jgi:hypothetical protein
MPARVADHCAVVCCVLYVLCAAVLQEVKSGDASRVRSLLARVTSLALPPKKMKGFFRWVCLIIVPSIS